MQNIEKPPVRFGEWISEGWKMFTEQWKTWVINTLIYVLICFSPLLTVAYSFYGYMLFQSSQHPRGAQPIAPGTLMTFFLLLGVTLIYTTLVAPFFTGGLHQMALKQLRGGRLEIRDLFSGGKFYFQIFIATLLIGIATLIGTMLCILPGFLVGGCLFFTIPLIIDRKLGPVEAMTTSYELVKQNIWMFTLFAFVVQLIVQAGSYACQVGMLATIPLLFTITAVAYRDTFGVEGAKYFTANPPPPDGYGYGQAQGMTYQPPAPDYGQGGFNPYANAGYDQPQPPFAAPPVNESKTESLSSPETASPIEPVEPLTPTEQVPEPPRFDATMPLSNVPLKPQASSGIVCSNCQMALPDTAGFCPRCGTRVER
jgi:uncharacterized membrane protein